MMVRLTYRSPAGTISSIYAEDFVLDMDEETYEGYQNILDKLAHYEDLEEAGRLVELPCKVDEFVWVAKKGENTRRVLLDSASDILWEIEHGYAIGYTSEEAEAALKERETE